uniref:Beta-glucosidase-like glycosyl hydrolase n=1 Tax=uncultured bacterium Contig46 TaxID=1393580 RepID=W0FMA3_9BACT|nr:beta-glucosidase-like glycosyl hydrolase [uncultured bacterium Contig46]
MNGYEKEHNEFLRRFGAECAVLLKTDGSFPPESPCDIALYGSGARCTEKGGTGSGEVYSRTFTAAGGDLVMPGSPGDVKALLSGLKNGTVTREQLAANAMRVYRTAKELVGGIK